MIIFYLYSTTPVGVDAISVAHAAFLLGLTAAALLLGAMLNTLILMSCIFFHTGMYMKHTQNDLL